MPVIMELLNALGVVRSNWPNIICAIGHGDAFHVDVSKYYVRWNVNIVTKESIVLHSTLHKR